MNITILLLKGHDDMESFMEKYNPDWTRDSLRIINTPSSLAKRTLFYIQEVGDFVTLPDYFTERAHMKSYFIAYTTEGRGALEYKGKKYALTPGTIVYINCMEHHKYYTDGEEWKFVWLHFHGATSDGYFREFARTHEPVITISPYTTIPAYIKSLIVANRQQTVRSEFISSKIITNILTDLLCSVEDENEKSQQIPAVIAEIARYIEFRFNEDITLDGLSAQFSLSKYHLAREFKRYIGFAPGEYLIRCRINESKNLLKNTDMPISDIAKAVGMDNESHFSSLFRRKVDMAPSQFRKTWERINF